jgi:hypothetical protein
MDADRHDAVQCSGVRAGGLMKTPTRSHAERRNEGIDGDRSGPRRGERGSACGNDVESENREHSEILEAAKRKI